MQEELESESEDDESEADSEDEDGDEVNSNGDLDDFVVADDAEDSETASEDDEIVKAEDEEEDALAGPSKKAVAKKSKGKGKAKEKVKSVKKSKKPKKSKEERRQEKKAKKGPVKMTMAELKRLATRSQKGRIAYIKKLNKDWVSSAKIEKAMETLKEIMENPEGEKVLIFSQWTSLLDLLECPIYREGWDYRRYDGSMNAGMRGDAVDDFRDPKKDVRIMLVSLKAGNAGLNLNMASQVIILDPFWNP